MLMSRYLTLHESLYSDRSVNFYLYDSVSLFFPLKVSGT